MASRGCAAPPDLGRSRCGAGPSSPPRASGSLNFSEGSASRWLAWATERTLGSGRTPTRPAAEPFSEPCSHQRHRLALRPVRAVIRHEHPLPPDGTADFCFAPSHIGDRDQHRSRTRRRRSLIAAILTWRKSTSRRRSNRDPPRALGLGSRVPRKSHKNAQATVNDFPASGHSAAGDWTRVRVRA
jgi:hypothetical protein